jgi:hypothetical protein
MTCRSQHGRNLTVALHHCFWLRIVLGISFFADTSQAGLPPIGMDVSTSPKRRSAVYPPIDKRCEQDPNDMAGWILILHFVLPALKLTLP